MVAGQYKSISAPERIPKHGLPVFSGRDLAHIQSAPGEEMTKRSCPSAWNQVITGTVK